MVFTCENHDLVVQIQLMQLMEGNQKNKEPLLYFTDPEYFAFQLMKKKQVVEKNNVQVGSWFSHVKTMNPKYKPNLCNSSKVI